MNALIDIAALAEQLRRVTVEVMDAGELLGSGVLWPAGCVVTNAHVVRRPEVTLRLVDGRCLRARVAGPRPGCGSRASRGSGYGHAGRDACRARHRPDRIVRRRHRPPAGRSRRAEHRHRVRDRSDRSGWALVDPGGPASGAGKLRRAACRCIGLRDRPELQGRRPLGPRGADERGHSLRPGRSGVSVVERRRLPPDSREREPSVAVVVVAGSEVVGARVEAMLRAGSGLPVTLSGPTELARRLDDHGRAVVVLALPSDAAARALEQLRGRPSVEAVVLLVLGSRRVLDGSVSPVGRSRGASRRRDRRGARSRDRRRQGRPRRAPSRRAEGPPVPASCGAAWRCRTPDTARARDPRDDGGRQEQSSHRRRAQDLGADGEIPRRLDPREARSSKPHGGGHVRRAARAHRALVSADRAKTGVSED